MYQGWTNHPTWLVNVWIDNDHGLYEYCQELKETQDVRAIAENLKQLIEDSKPDTPGLFSDLLESALDSVNWREIAENLLEE